VQRLLERHRDLCGERKWVSRKRWTDIFPNPTASVPDSLPHGHTMHPWQVSVYPSPLWIRVFVYAYTCRRAVDVNVGHRLAARSPGQGVTKPARFGNT
jgi:hypothetical protein